MEPKRRRFGDRKDGWRLRHTQSVFAVMPHLMKRRSDAQVFFDEEIDIEYLEKYVRALRKEHDMPNFSLYHLMIAAVVRMFVLRPRLNRFVMNGKTYARSRLTASMTAKRSMSKDAEESNIKPRFEKTDTIFDVYRRVNEAMEKEVKTTQVENSTDIAARILNTLPAFLVRAFVNFIIFMDHRGWMNNFINDISPFHTSFYITDVGSIGIQPIYHHLYDFGTTSVFVAMGKKTLVPVADAERNVSTKKVVRIKLVLDERICDGHYYAESFRMLRRILKHPEVLETPPTEFPEDEWI